jgi:hypothetical protein
MLDLSKAFDSIHHETQLMKLRKLGVSDEALPWFASYLSDRQQRVRINSSLSSSLTIRHGVSQGSILGPLLFNLYINDLPTVLRTCNVESCGRGDSKLQRNSGSDHPQCLHHNTLLYITHDCKLCGCKLRLK